MTLKKDKQKVLGEHFDDARIRTFLEYQPHGNGSPDFHILEKAYRGMNEENFATLVQFFVEAGHDVNAKGPQGKTFLQVISDHRHAGDYIVALRNAGAR